MEGIAPYTQTTERTNVGDGLPDVPRTKQRHHFHPCPEGTPHLQNHVPLPVRDFCFFF